LILLIINVMCLIVINVVVVYILFDCVYLSVNCKTIFIFGAVSTELGRQISDLPIESVL